MALHYLAEDLYNQYQKDDIETAKKVLGEFQTAFDAMKNILEAMKSIPA